MGEEPCLVLLPLLVQVDNLRLQGVHVPVQLSIGCIHLAEIIVYRTNKKAGQCAAGLWIRIHFMRIRIQQFF